MASSQHCYSGHAIIRSNVTVISLAGGKALSEYKGGYFISLEKFCFT